jgi:hypothetical protein
MLGASGVLYNEALKQVVSTEEAEDDLQISTEEAEANFQNLVTAGTAIRKLITMYNSLGVRQTPAAGEATPRQALDIHRLWDEDEDSVMQAYLFFGWDNVTRPTKTAIASAVQGVYRTQSGSRGNPTNTAITCNVHLVIMLRALYSPEFEAMLDISKNNWGNGASVIANAMYSNFSVAPGTEELATPCGNKLYKCCCCF